MKIIRGLQDYMVLQRTADQVSHARFVGESTQSGAVTVTVTCGDAVAPGFAHAVIGDATGGTVQGVLQGLPVGGPYEITLRIEDSAGQVLDQLEIHDVLVGDVWVLAGQSNMQGAGAHADAASPHPMVRAFAMDDRWSVAQDPLHDLSIAIDPVHSDLKGGQRPAPEPLRGTGPGVAFGQEMYRLTGVPQGLIACAHGGTTMLQWDPKLKRKGGHSLYGAMLRRVTHNGGAVAGVVWYQGCQDGNDEHAPHYTQRMQALIRAMRRDFGHAALPVTAVQIARHSVNAIWGPGWTSIRTQQYRLPALIRRLTLVAAIDLPLDDNVHLSGVAQQRLGKRLARAMHTLITGAGQPPITVKCVTLAPNAIHGGTDIRVEFAHVAESLQAFGAPLGFVLVDASGAEIPVYRTDLAGNSAILHTGIHPEAMRQHALYYGFGLNPICTITDAEDRAVPAFGPIALADVT